MYVIRTPSISSLEVNVELCGVQYMGQNRLEDTSISFSNVV